MAKGNLTGWTAEFAEAHVGTIEEFWQRWDAGTIKSDEGTDFEESLAALKSAWEVREALGPPMSEADRVWDLVSLELRFSANDKPRQHLQSIRSHVRQWMETRNPHYVDAAFLDCRKAGIAPTPTLLKLMEEVSTLRLAGLDRGGTGKQIHNSRVHSEALRIVCFLHLSGLSVPVAASKAARYISDQNQGKRYKASTLERDYCDHFRVGKPSLEDFHREALSRTTDYHRDGWPRGQEPR